MTVRIHGVLAADQMPPEDEWLVEVSVRTKYKPNTKTRNYQWETHLRQRLEPWHIWRSLEGPTEELLKRARYQRRKHGVVASEHTRFYMRKEDAARVP